MVRSSLQRTIDYLARFELSESYGCLRLSVEMENLPVVVLLKWHKQTASAELTVVNNHHWLKHVVVEALCHAVKRPHILVESTDEPKIAPRFKIRSQRQISRVITDRRTDCKRSVGMWIVMPVILDEPLHRSKPNWRWREIAFASREVALALLKSPDLEAS